MDLLTLNMDEVLPHRGRMRLVSKVLSFDETKGDFLIPVLSSSPFLGENGLFKSSWLVELVAQAAACHCGCKWLGIENKPGTYGYVIAVDHCAVEANVRLNVGDILHVQVVLEFDLPPAGVFRGVVRFKEREIGQATIKTFVEAQQGLYGESRHDAQESSSNRR
jgi:predicted hotdog family 3-hydroxylacyl-ACP dehydratase